MLKLNKILCVFFLSMSFAFAGFAQEMEENEYNYNSVRPVRNADIMHSKTVWLRMDLREKLNESLFASNNEISKIIIDAVKQGVLRPYKNDKLNERMSVQTFLDNLKIPNVGNYETEIWEDENDTEIWGEEVVTTGSAQNGAEEFFAKQINILEFKEDVLFDKKHSKTIHDIQSVTLVIPADLFSTGIEKKLATFSYKELVENVFLDNPAALWYNAKNVGENRNLSDAFDLRLLAAKIVKYSNPKDNLIEDIYAGNQKLSLAKAQEYEHSLVEYESNLWSN